MRRLAGRMTTLASGALLLMLVLSCALWAASYGPSTRANLRAGDWTFLSQEGQIEVIHQLPVSPGIVLPPGMPTNVATPGIAGVRTPATNANVERWYLGQVGRIDAYSWDHRNNTTARTSAVHIRYSLLTVLAAVGTFLMGWRGVRARRARLHIERGLCGACGYDLRASSGRCPECGAGTTTAPVGVAPVPSGGGE